MVIETNKLYLVSDISTATNERPALLELKGTVSLTIYGSEENADTLLALTDLTPASEAIAEDFYQTLSEVPKYIAFIGTAGRINLKGRQLKFIRDIS